MRVVGVKCVQQQVDGGAADGGLGMQQPALQQGGNVIQRSGGGVPLDHSSVGIVFEKKNMFFFKQNKFFFKKTLCGEDNFWDSQ